MTQETEAGSSGGDATEGLPLAVIDHSPPTRIYCRECAYGQSIAREPREELSESQIGDVLVCDGCGVDIATTIERDTDD